MRKVDEYLDFEELYHREGGRRLGRKERKIRSGRNHVNQEGQKKRRAFHTSHTPDMGEKIRGRVVSVARSSLLVQIDNALIDVESIGGVVEGGVKNPIVVGDWVWCVKRGEGVWQVIEIEPRKTFLLRAAHFFHRKQQVIGANIDQVFIVLSVALPLFTPFLIPRYLLAAHQGGVEPIVLINKSDLLSSDVPKFRKQKGVVDECIASYQAAGVKVLCVSTLSGENIDTLIKMMENKVSLFSGQSGVGKSSLLNRTLGENLRIGAVSGKTQKGSHTTSSSKLIFLKQGGGCIDTPGVKSFGLWRATKGEILALFPEFVEYAAKCQFINCCHISEKACGVKEGVCLGNISKVRYDGYVHLMNDPAIKQWD